MPAVTENTATSFESRQLSALPNEVLMMAESQWLFTEAELLRTPSIVDGMAPEQERENRRKGVNFILQVGIMLKLPQITLATASVFLHRFYMRRSMQDVPNKPGFHYYSMAATSLFLATKVEENCRKMKELVIACVRVAQKDPYKMVDEQDKEYWRWRDNILHNEDLLLEAICFDLSLEPPYKTLFDLLLYFGEEGNKKLRNAAWAFVNDSCMTMLCLLFSSKTIAASALYAAAKHAGVAFQDDENGRPWWRVIRTDLGNIRKACNYMAEIYEKVPAKAGRDGSLYERTPEVGDEWDDSTRTVGPQAESRRNSGNSLEDMERHLPKRERDDGPAIEEKPHTNGAAADCGKSADYKTIGPTEESPRKRQRLDNEGECKAVDVVTQHGQQSNGVQPILATSPLHLSLNEAQLNGAVSHADEPADEGAGGLVSPKLDDVSEEGEVEP